ncbi:MAG: hypothetical protein HYX40_08180 [Sphingobacteriales bacterium]|nr:hypothetical protein [Sphingobacteriales bacterium]
MKILVIGTIEQQNEFRVKKLPDASEVFFLSDPGQINMVPSAFTIFDLGFEPDSERIKLLASINKPVFINSVINSLKGLHLPDNFIRINAWPGFFERSVTEVAIGYREQEQSVQTVFQLLQWPFQIVPDTPGMISARVISMIINEAYFALGEGVSTKKEIDVAMKLGTNYPLGPFEWCEKIGYSNIYKLLLKLSATNERYAIAPLLIKEVQSNENILWR